MGANPLNRMPLSGVEPLLKKTLALTPVTIPIDNIAPPIIHQK
ncbi:protein of unknown function [Xenorhabdus bovienii]|uniref:Uncharacterized protein n=1 Tax=Xenorhabdus bovienii TaxID=40576 RepID=A0A0B6XF04_XENBV|nr:protein of unknown function [Xenorhabdus bovienii]